MTFSEYAFFNFLQLKLLRDIQWNFLYAFTTSHYSQSMVVGKPCQTKLNESDLLGSMLQHITPNNVPHLKA